MDGLVSLGFEKMGNCTTIEVLLHQMVSFAWIGDIWTAYGRRLLVEKMVPPVTERKQGPGTRQSSIVDSYANA